MIFDALFAGHATAKRAYQKTQVQLQLRPRDGQPTLQFFKALSLSLD